MWPFSRKPKEKIPDYAAEAEAMYRTIADDHGLALIKNEGDPVELSMTFPKQNGLQSEIWVCLQNIDELWFVVEGITYSTFPFEKVKDDFEETLRALITGKYKFVTWKQEGEDKPYRAEIHEPSGEDWNRIFTYGRGIGFLRKKSNHIVRKEFFLNELGPSDEH